jgi:Mg-chelatase subunit ChlD
MDDWIPLRLDRRLWRVIPLLAALFFLLAQPHTARAQNASCGEPQRTHGTLTLERCVKRTFNYAGQTKTVIVYFTTANGEAADRLRAVDSDGNGSLDRSADSLAGFLADWTVNAWRTYRDYGFPDPLGRNDIKVIVYDMRPGLLGWCCTADEWQIEAAAVINALSFGGDPRDAESIAYHEMWHAARWSEAFKCWAIEGGASHMTDHVTLEVDNDPTNDYMGRVWGYLTGGAATGLTEHCYNAALWWQYFSERTSSGNDPVRRGVDSVKAFWDHPAATDFTRMDAIIQSRAPGNTFESLWIDFAVANYAKDLPGPNVQAKYRYFDETHAGAPDYPPVMLTNSYNVTPGAPVIPTLDSIQPWSAKYYEFRPASNVPIINLAVRQELNRRAAYVMLAVRNNDIVREERGIGQSFTRSFSNNSFDRIILIVVGLNEQANFRYSLNAQMTLNIVDPLQARPATVGRHDAPDKLLIKVDVFAGPGGEPVSGIDPGHFAITVGNAEVTPAQRISAAYVQGQYWLLVRAPTQSAAGTYNLTVSFAGLTDTELSSVRYQARNDVDSVVVLDRSGSMGEYAKMPAAKDAARLFVDSWRAGDLIGVASFDDDATVNLQLGAFETERNNALNAINAISLGGATSIGDGLQAGLDQLIARGNASHDWTIMILSDGIENRDITIAKFLETYAARRNASPPQKAPRILAVALGPDADRARMENLAAQTGGVYYVAALPGQGLAAAATDAFDLSTDLAEIYRSAAEVVAKQSQVYADIWPVDHNVPSKVHTIRVDGAASQAVFVVKWNKDVLGRDVVIEQPDGTPYTQPPAQTDSRHMVWRIANPQPGAWKLSLNEFENAAHAVEPAAIIEYATEILVEAAVTSDLTFDVFLGLPVEQRLVGKPMPIFAALADSAAISGATVSALVRTPGSGFYSVTLYDDGKHGDGAANDGFYGGIFYVTHRHGAYDVVVTANGNSPRTGAFTRRVRVGFNMLQSRSLTFDPNFPNYDPNLEYNPDAPDAADHPNRGVVDKDGDGLIDWWEVETGLDPDNTRGGQRYQDPDFDGLSNQEEFEIGTDPLSSDSDGGGQNDGSEWTSGNDPLDAALDQTPCPMYFEASPTLQEHDEHIYTGAVVLYYDVNPDHSYFLAWRRPAGGARELIPENLPATGVYSDTAVSEGVVYDYWISAYDAEGHASCILGPSRVVLSPDAVKPEGVVTINNGAAKTDSVQVTLQFNATTDTTEMQVRNSVAAFSATDGWEPYKPSRSWTLAPINGMAAVFVLYRDAAGNVSEPASDLIEAAAETKVFLPVLRR